MIYGYIRVSTDRQATRNQQFEIQQYCARENLPVEGWIQETISGTKAYDKRALGRLLKKVKKGDFINPEPLHDEGVPCPLSIKIFIGHRV